MDKFTPKRIAELRAAKEKVPATMQMNNNLYVEWLIDVAPDLIEEIAEEICDNGHGQVIIAAKLEEFIDAIDKSEIVSHISEMVAAHKILWNVFKESA